MNEGHFGDQPRSARPRNGDSRLFTFLFIIIGLLIVAGTFTFLQRRAQYRALAKETESLAMPTVAVTHPTLGLGDEDLVLPGMMQPYVEAPIYARTNGYLKKWYHDIGSRVRKGELLADIDAPEVDQQLSQARAELSTAKATANLSQITANRYQDLLKTDSVSKQEADNAAGDLEAKKANVQSSEANVRRLKDLESFKHIYAPFSGVITKRNVDVGTLINAGNGGSAQQLFFLAQTDPIRAFVNVPEVYAATIRSGLDAFVALAQLPGQKFAGKVVRSAEAIDPGTRTLLTEIDVPNHDNKLLPGGYGQVHLAVKVNGARLQVPVNALLFRAEGLRAVVVDEHHKIHLRALTIGRDFGTKLEVLQGLNAADWIVVNPADSLDEDQEVRVKELPAQNASPATAHESAPDMKSPARDSSKVPGESKR
jgi:RND family efflux transporter MFP subunit